MDQAPTLKTDETMNRRKFLKASSAGLAACVLPAFPATELFNGTQDYLTRGPELTGLADGVKGSIEVYFWPEYIDLSKVENRREIIRRVKVRQLTGLE